MRELRAVCITHMHADHHGALYGLLELRAQMGAPPLLVVGPMPLFRVLEGYSDAVSVGMGWLGWWLGWLG